MLFSICALAATPADAAGFAVASQGAGAFGLAGSATARFDLPEVGFYNPAAWGMHEGLRASIGATLIAPNIAHVGTAGESTPADPGVSVPPYLYVGYGFGELAVGLNAGIPFGSGLRWPDEAWPGRFEVTRIDLKTYEVGASLVWRPLEALSISAGPRLVRSTVQLERNIDAVTSEGRVSVGGEGTGFGAQAAVAIHPTGALTLGATYRSRVRVEYSGAAHFEVPIELSAQARDGQVTTAFVFPDRITAGAAYEIGAATVSLDAEVTLWSTYDALRIDFKNDATPDVTSPKRWSDVVAVRAGYEHRVLDGLDLRGGLAFDPSPSPSDTLSPTSPDGDRILLTAGASYLFGAGVSAHLAYGHVFFLGAEAGGTEALPGSYDASAELVSLGLSYAIDPAR